ncbi:Arabinogalactan protein 16/20/22/41 [Dillenia turbinata]|uniref:Arabinogalactan protein 16/20/22/41 n=1 Tax=Dillenia turbinata TaxID=194707 RepID=A0AAN8WF78_9MAGN
MEMLRISVITTTLLGFVLSMASVNARSPQPTPPPSRLAIDQGIAYALMLVALVLAYIIH